MIERAKTLTEGRALWVLMFVGPLVLISLYLALAFTGLNTPEALELAQLGRNLSAGQGFNTYVIRPLALVHGTNPLQQPDGLHGPLFPFFLALAFGAMGTRDLAAADVSALFYILTVPLVYLLGLRLFDKRTGLLAAALFALNAQMLGFAASGREVTLQVFLFTALCLTLYRIALEETTPTEGPDATAPKAMHVLAGLLTGALYLTDPAFFWLLLVLTALLLATSRDRKFVALWYGLPMLLLALPWWIRNANALGSPFLGLRSMELWMETTYYPGTLAYRLTPHELEPGLAMLNAVIKKLFVNLGREAQSLPNALGAWILAFFLPSLFFGFRDVAAAGVRRVLFFSFLALTLGTVLFTLRIELFAALIPAVMVFAVAYLLHLIEQSGLERVGVGIVLGLAAVILLFPLFSSLRNPEYNVLSRASVTASLLNRMTDRDALVFSDQPWTVAWYADRPSVLIPAREQRIGEIRTNFKTARWLFLTENTRELSPSWSAIYNAFQQWNNIVAQRRAYHLRPPDPVLIQDQTDPLFKSLSGFASVEAGQNPGAVLATVMSNAPASPGASNPGTDPAAH